MQSNGGDVNVAPVCIPFTRRHVFDWRDGLCVARHCAKAGREGGHLHLVSVAAAALISDWRRAILAHWPPPLPAGVASSGPCELPERASVESAVEYAFWHARVGHVAPQVKWNRDSLRLINDCDIYINDFQTASYVISVHVRYTTNMCISCPAMPDCFAFARIHQSMKSAAFYRMSPAGRVDRGIFHARGYGRIVQQHH